MAADVSDRLRPFRKNRTKLADNHNVPDNQKCLLIDTEDVVKGDAQTEALQMMKGDWITLGLCCFF